MKEVEWTPRNEYLSELRLLRNRLLAQVAEVDMAIDREELGNPTTTKTVTLQSEALLRRAQQPKPLWTTPQYQEQAMQQSDTEVKPPVIDKPPYEHLTQ